VYGNGADLGNFKFFADDLKRRELGKKYKVVGIERTITCDAFLSAITRFGRLQPIGELHIFSHSFGGGLSLAYGDSFVEGAIDNAESYAVVRKRRLTYAEVIQALPGSLITDRLVSPQYVAKKAEIQKLFSPFATIKIWGCNSGRNNYVYSDGNGAGGETTDQSFMLDADNEALGYFWRALNTQNVPKPAVAKAMAQFFDRPVFGAKSGSSIQVKDRARWISSTQFQKIHRRPAGERDDLRLNPDFGGYVKFMP
jgi:hypothetical protein